MPTLAFLAIAYQLQSKNWRYVFFLLAAASVILNIFLGRWAVDFYSAVLAFLLCLLNPLFGDWWQKRNARTDTSSKQNLRKATLQHFISRKFEILFWIAALAITWVAIYFYWIYTGHVILGWLTGLCLSVFILKKFLVAALPFEIFFQEKSTRYIALVVLISWVMAELIFGDLSDHFVMPMVIVLVLGLIGMYLVRGNTRFLIPGCVLVLADVVWQVIRFIQNSELFIAQVLSSESIIVIAILIGIVWMLKKPGVLPIIFLTLFQLFRFSAFTFQAVDRASSAALTTPEVTFYMVYLVSWMFLVPWMFWFVGTWQAKKSAQAVAR